MVRAVWAHDSGLGLVRYSTDGTLDRTFGNNGSVVIRSAQRSFVANALALQPDGKIVLGGMNSDLASGSIQLAVARYSSDGTPDASFSSDGMVTTPVGDGGAQANTIALQRDGEILVAGTAFAHGATSSSLLAMRPAGLSTAASAPRE